MNGSISIWIAGPLPGLNEILRAKGASGAPGARGRRWNAYGALKKEWEAKISAAARLATAAQTPTVSPFDGPVEVGFYWVEVNHRRDLDNIAAGKKLVFDGLVASGLLAGDGWKHVRGFWDQFTVGTPAGVRVTILPATEEEEP